MTVFANGLEISSKAQSCKVIAAFPDVCMTPPQAPPTPPGVPIPYPNFAVDGDLTKGTGTVKIKDKEVSQENASKFSKVTGDEAGAAPKKGVVSSNKGGPAYAQKWSMDVKFEGKGVVRFSDIATTNHGCVPANEGAPMVVVASPTAPPGSSDRKCIVGKYGEITEECNANGGEAHHIIPDEYFRKETVADCGIDLPAATMAQINKTQGARGKMEIVARYAKANDITPDPTRKDPAFPSTEEGCCVCVGGNAAGKQPDERTSDPGTKVKKKGIAHKARVDKKAEGLPAGGKKEFIGFHMGRGHGFAHFVFDTLFGKGTRPVAEVLKLAQFTLAEMAHYDETVVDSECAELAAQCVQKQMDDVAKKKPKVEPGRNHRNSPVLDDRMQKSGADIGALRQKFATFSPSST